MELMKSASKPQIEVMFDLASSVRICAVLFSVACVAMVSRCTVTRSTSHQVRLYADQVIAFGTFPAVKAGMVAKACKLILVRPAL